MKKYIATLALMGGLACADNVRYRGSSVQIKFDEPVVPQSVCQNRWDSAASDADKGLDLFDVTGDDQHKPKMHWVDQNLLEVEFVEGTSCATEYRLSFRPGCGKYLSEKKMPQTAFTFRHPRTRLQVGCIVEGLDEGATVVMPGFGRTATKEEQTFSPETAITYTYHQIVREEYTDSRGVRRFRQKEGAKVPAKVEPALLKHAPQHGIERLRPTKPDWAAVTPDTPLPNAVLVQPSTPLPAGTDWELRCSESVGFDKTSLSSVHQVNHDLQTMVDTAYQDKELKVGVAFRAKVTTEEAERAWRDMEVSAGGVKAVNSADGKTKTLTINGKECRISLKEILAFHPTQFTRYYRGPENDEESGAAPEPVCYVEQGTTRGFILKVEGQTPTVMDFVVPQGVVTALGGRKTLTPHRHRLSLNPAWPLLQGVLAPYRAGADTGRYYSRGTMQAVLPLKGGHKLRVPVVNADGLKVTAYRVPGDMAVTQADKLAQAVQSDGTPERIVNLTVQLERHARKVEVLDSKRLDSVQKELAKARAHKQNPTAHALAAKLQASQELEVAVPEGDNTNLYCTEAVLDMDALLGGKAAPGIYLVRLVSHAYPSVRKTLADLKLPEDTLDVEQFVLVQITDLNASANDDSHSVIISRLSDGTPVEHSKVTAYLLREKRTGIGRASSYEEVPVQEGEPAEATGGFISMEKTLGLGRGQVYLLVESGDDYTVTSYGYGVWNQWTAENDYRTMLQLDRSLYRPGETVHVRGVLRCVDPKGDASLPNSTTVVFTVRKPNRQELVKRTITLDASGGIDESFTLPDGEEDVTGGYSIEVRTPDGRYRAGATAQAQIFRRDAFKVTTELTVDPIAPKGFSLKIQAVDYNGTPLANGKVTMDISSPQKLLTFQGGKRPQNEQKEGDGHRSGSESFPYTMQLDEQGKAEIKGEFVPFKPRDGGSLYARGSVANDREEYVSFTTWGGDMYSADFVPGYDTASGLITLKGVTKTDKGVSTSEPLAREQKVHATLHYTAKETKTLPNGFVYMSTKPAVLKEEDVTVPANCRDGVEWNARAMWEEFAKAHPEDGTDPYVVLTGTDTAGRCVERETRVYTWGRRESGAEVPYSGTDKCKLGEDGRLHYNTAFLRDGTAYFLIYSASGVRHVVQPVKAGEQEVILPVVEGDEGGVCVTAHLMHPDDTGVFTRYENHDAGVTLPHVKHALQTQLDVPKEPVAPGASVTLSGQVTKDGKGVPATVTLFAVDEGMLSLSRYTVQDLPSYFAGRSNARSLDFNPSVSRVKDVNGQWVPNARMITGIWRGSDMDLDDVEVVEYSAMAGSGVVRGKKMAMRSSKAVAPQAVACNGVQADACAMECDDDDDCEMECAAPAPCAVNELGEEFGYAGGAEESAPAPRLRTNFQPVAVWQGVLKTDAEGRFSANAVLPDTLTTYKVYALVLGDDGSTFGNAEAAFTVNQPLMLTPGTPLFMSTGDTLRLPLTVTNNTDEDGTWTVTISSAKEPQKVSIKAHGTATVYFDFTAVEEGENKLEWTAVGGKTSDAVQGTFPVRFPAPVLKEAHHLVIAPGQEQKLADLLAPELATSTRGEVEIHMSANPLLHLVGCMDYLLDYPYGCTEQTASGLLPWLFYDRLAPLSPMLAETPADKVHEVIAKSVETLFKRQKSDGGLGYWGDSDRSCAWASAHAALVLTIAIEQGHGDCIPMEKMEKLRGYLRGYLAELRKDGEKWDAAGPMTLFALGRVLEDKGVMDAALGLAAKYNAESREWGWWWHRDIGADLTLIRELHKNPAGKHAAFLQWMRARGHDYRHTTTLRSSWMLIALNEYLRLTPASTKEATVQLQDGMTLTLNQGVTVLKPQAKPLSALPTVLKAVQGEVYVTFKAKARPNQTEYPGVVEKGLQITRIYEKKGADGVWREAKEFNTGDVVRVTLTCAKSAPELEYFVLEDYLPSCMEAINPNVPSQAAGLEWRPWSHWFDHKEYLADRVRGFCTRWGGRDLLNMSYYARVKRAGTCTAPPAQAQLMYEPQTYGLSPNKKVQSK